VNFHIDIVQRPGWSSKTTWFARVTDSAGKLHECTHSHSRRDLAVQCALKIVDGRVAVSVRLDNI